MLPSHEAGGMEGQRELCLVSSVLGSAAEWLCVSKSLNCCELQFYHLKNGVTPNFIGKVNDKKKKWKHIVNPWGS